MPCTPIASIVFRSAWMPAPPPESEPAMARTRGGAGIMLSTLRARPESEDLQLPRRRQRGLIAGRLHAEVLPARALGHPPDERLRVGADRGHGLASAEGDDARD